jgi:hypothetical protein
MAVQIQIRRGISTEWSSTDPILADGEIAYEKDTRQIKIGDGSSTWNTLPIYSPNTIGIATIISSAVISGVVTATNYVSTAATGTAPLTVNSSTLNVNLNADFLDGQHGSYYQNASNINAGTLNANRLPDSISLSNLNVSGIATIGTVTATEYYGSGVNLTGIVTSIVAGSNIAITTSNGQVTISAGTGGGEGGDPYSGIGTPLSVPPRFDGDILNLIYKTQKSETIPPNTLKVISSDAISGNIAFTKLNDIIIGTGSTLVISTGTTFITNVLNIF